MSVDVQNADIEIEVRSDNKMLGRLKISKGSIDWLPGGHVNHYELSWEKFAEVMVANGAQKQNAPRQRS